MGNSTLDISNVISISIQGTASGLGTPNINTAALFSKDSPSGWAGGQAFAIYTNPTDVATDFGSGSNAAAIATSFFAQQPNVLQTGGYLVVIPRLTSPSLETVQAAIVRTLNLVYYFGVLIDEEMNGGLSSDFASLTTYVQSLDKMFFYASSTKADFATSGLMDLIRSGSKTHTRCGYYSTGTEIDTQAFAAAFAGRGLSTDFNGSRTTQTMHLKTLAGINPDSTIAQTDLTAAQLAGVSAYVSIAGVPSLFTSGANAFFDEVYNELWLKFALQTAGFNYLRSAGTKVPQTEIGIEGLKNEYRKVCDQAVNNGFVAPGAWNSSTVFGDPSALIRCVKDIGYYVYSQPVAQQLQADREARKAPTIQIAIKSAGAVHRSNVIVNVNL